MLTCDRERLKTMLVWMFLLACCSMAIPGCNFLGNLPTPAPPDDNKPDPVEPDHKYSEDAHWEALAVVVEAESFADTDELVWTVRKLKEQGHLNDISRIQKYELKREEIDSSNANFIANALRGG